MELKNSEHYNDPTPYEAHKNIRKEEQLEAARMRTISTLVSALKQVADLAGAETRAMPDPALLHETATEVRAHRDHEGR